jgi:hypothetical protein
MGIPERQHLCRAGHRLPPLFRSTLPDRFPFQFPDALTDKLFLCSAELGKPDTDELPVRRPGIFRITHLGGAIQPHIPR